MEEMLQVAGCTADAEHVHDKHDLQKLYNAFMRGLEVKHGKLLQELFLEHPELFMVEEKGSEVDALRASQEKIKEIHEALKVCWRKGRSCSGIRTSMNVFNHISHCICIL